jgi:hypothetical protein
VARVGKLPKRPTWTATGLVEAPPHAVSSLMLTIKAGPVSADTALLVATTYQPIWGGREVIIRGGPREYSASVGRVDGDDVSIEVDRAENSIVLRGNWWYAGVHSVHQHRKGTLISHRAYNVAPGIGRLAVPLVSFRFEAQIRDGMQRFLDAAGQRLRCSTQMVP